MKKYRQKKEHWSLIVIGLIVIALLTGAVVFLRLKKEPVSEKAEMSVASATSVSETAAGEISEETTAEEYPAETTAKTTVETSAETSTETTPETLTETSAETSAETTAETSEEISTETTAETSEETSAETTAETTEEETSPQLLENLDEYRPGDVIDRNRFDFDHYKKYFVVYEISPQGNVYKRINGKSYVKNNDIALSDLRYIQMPHYNFNGEIQLGELIVNKAIAGSIVEIFEKLFESKYQIEKMYLIDNYWTGDGNTTDDSSCAHNNTSAFCYRPSTEGGSLSSHAIGMAIDINPQQNPYVSYSTGEAKWMHANANDYIARDTGLPHMITHSDAAYKLFTAYGFTWGGDWTDPKDYQHFVKK